MEIIKMVLLVLVVIVSGVVWVSCARQSGDPVALGEARQALKKEDALLLDVRTGAEHRMGHIEGSLNIPVGDLGERVGELGKDKNRPIVVYCRSGARSQRAAAQLRAAGFTQVHDIGPMSAWSP